MTATTDFAKSKMHFTLAMLGTLFALHPFFHMFDKLSFTYMGQVIPVSYALVCAGVCLAGAAYFYAADLVNDHPSALSQRLGNMFYALAIMSVPIYAGLFLTTLVEDEIGDWVHINFRAPMITIGILVFWGAMWCLGTYLIRRYLSKKDWTSRVDLLADMEMEALKKAKDLMDSEHADLAIIQYHKAIITRLKMACMKRGVYNHNPIGNARTAGIINNENEKFLDIVVKHAQVAASTVPADHVAAKETAAATKRLLATISV